MEREKVEEQQKAELKKICDQHRKILSGMRETAATEWSVILREHQASKNALKRKYEKLATKHAGRTKRRKERLEEAKEAVEADKPSYQEETVDLMGAQVGLKNLNPLSTLLDTLCQLKVEQIAKEQDARTDALYCSVMETRTKEPRGITVEQVDKVCMNVAETANRMCETYRIHKTDPLLTYEVFIKLAKSFRKESEWTAQMEEYFYLTWRCSAMCDTKTKGYERLHDRFKQAMGFVVSSPPKYITSSL